MLVKKKYDITNRKVTKNHFVYYFTMEKRQQLNDFHITLRDSVCWSDLESSKHLGLFFSIKTFSILPYSIDMDIIVNLCFI